MKKMLAILTLSIISSGAFAAQVECTIPKIYCYDSKGNEIIYANVKGKLDSAGNCSSDFLCPAGGSALTSPRPRVQKMLAPKAKIGL